MIDPRLAIRLKRAWKALTNEQRARIRPLAERAHTELGSILSTRAMPAPITPIQHRELIYFKAALEDREEVYVRSAIMASKQSAALGEVIGTDPSGNIIGFGKYQLLDPGWLEAGVVWLEDLAFGDVFPFGTELPGRRTIPNNVNIALAGDFGTGDWGRDSNPAASTKIRILIKGMTPDISIHLGDVYYAGTNGSEQANLITIWPAGSIASLTMNSNHEMYPGGWPFYDEALNDSKFQFQNKRSFFALENDYWILVGLDSAYGSDPLNLYSDGALDNGGMQLAFLKDCVATGKRIVLLSHHNALNEQGTGKTQLWTEVVRCISGCNFLVLVLGHKHVGAVYTDAAGNGLRCRSIGHAGIPWANATELKNSSVVWYESRNAEDPDDMQRVLNGFAMLSLNGKDATEVFFDESGCVAWRSGEL